MMERSWMNAKASSNVWNMTYLPPWIDCRLISMDLGHGPERLVSRARRAIEV